MKQLNRIALSIKFHIRDINSASIAIVILSALGSYLIFYVTHWGPLISSDSIEYVAAARNMIAGRGLVVPRPDGDFQALQFFPPLYPLVLGLMGLSGIEMLVLARWINVLLFGVTLALMGFVLLRLTSSAWFSLAPIALILSYPIFSTKVFSEAMSEPLFFTFSILQIVLMLNYLKKRTFSSLLGSTILAGLTILTRNVGIVIVITGAAAIVLFQAGSRKKRIGQASFFFTASCLPFAIWRLSLLNQNLVIQGIDLDSRDAWSRFATFRFQIVEKLWDWLPFLNGNISIHYRMKLLVFVFVAVFSALLFAWLIHLVRRQGIHEWASDNSIRVNGILFLLIITYLFVLAFSFLFVKPRPVLGGRLLSPVLMLTLILPFTLASSVIRLKPSLKWIQLVLFGLALASVAFWIPTTLANALDLHTNGRGVTSDRWRSSETIEAVQQFPADIAIISNEADAILFFTGRSAYRIAELFYQTKLETFTRYGDNLQDPAERLFHDNDAALVLFDSIKGQFTILYSEEAERRLAAFVRGLAPYSHYSDGSIYFYSEMP